MKQNQLLVSIWKIIPTCYYRNKGEVENIIIWLLTYRALGGGGSNSCVGDHHQEVHHSYICIGKDSESLEPFYP